MRNSFFFPPSWVKMIWVRAGWETSEYVQFSHSSFFIRLSDADWIALGALETIDPMKLGEMVNVFAAAIPDLPTKTER